MSYSISSIRTQNAAVSLAYQPVAIFVGGTSGVGAGMARAFARHRQGAAHIILIGRNRQAAQEVLDSFPKPKNGEYKHEFIECDVTLMRNVRATTSELLQRLPKLNFLALSPGILTFQGRDETDEGIDKKLALHYYARWRFTYDLVPLLQKAADAGEDAKVMTVLSAGVDGGEIDLNDLGLKKGFSLPAAARAASVYNDLMVKTFAEKYPAMAFTHSAPGIVRSNLMRGHSSEWMLKALYPLAVAVSYAAGISLDDCGEYMWHGFYAATKGAFRRGSRGEDIGDKALFCNTDEAKQKLWEHTLEATS